MTRTSQLLFSITSTYPILAICYVHRTLVSHKFSVNYKISEQKYKSYVRLTWPVTVTYRWLDKHIRDKEATRVSPLWGLNCSILNHCNRSQLPMVNKNRIHVLKYSHFLDQGISTTQAHSINSLVWKLSSLLTGGPKCTCQACATAFIPLYSITLHRIQKHY